MGHHPVYSYGHHGSQAEMIERVLPLLEVRAGHGCGSFAHGMMAAIFSCLHLCSSPLFVLSWQTNRLDANINGHDHNIQHIKMENRYARLWMRLLECSLKVTWTSILPVGVFHPRLGVRECTVFSLPCRSPFCPLQFCPFLHKRSRLQSLAFKQSRCGSGPQVLLARARIWSSGDLL